MGAKKVHLDCFKTMEEPQPTNGRRTHPYTPPPPYVVTTHNIFSLYLFKYIQPLSVQWDSRQMIHAETESWPVWLNEA